MLEPYLQIKGPRRRPPTFELIAGAVCLDFINTLDDRFSKQPKELLKKYHHLVLFGEDTGILSTLEADRLFTYSSMSPEPSKKALEDAIRMREAMFGVFDAIVKRKPVPTSPLMHLNSFIRGAGTVSRVVPAVGKFEWRFDGYPFDKSSILWPIARSAADLLTSDELRYVRTCASNTCQWFFLDTSKNHRRRWCDMTKCGNRAKFRRFYSRQKKQK